MTVFFAVTSTVFVLMNCVSTFELHLISLATQGLQGTIFYFEETSVRETFQRADLNFDFLLGLRRRLKLFFSCRS